MKKSLLLIPITIILAIFFYPTTSNSNSTGSVGGKTGSPTDGASCTGCHYAGVDTGASITTNTGGVYVPGQVYEITAEIQGTSSQFGFEITAEEANPDGAKAGIFQILDFGATQLTNNNKAVTHTLSGTQSSTPGIKSWSMGWVAPSAGTGDVTFYGAFMEGNMDGSNSGDTYHSATLTISEMPVVSTNNISSENQFLFNPITKTIQLLGNAKVYVYSIDGKLVISSNKEHTSLTHLSKGTYIIESENETQKIILN
ncbi:MAG: choice-of-anchor V domain-containing protein [Bacteroidota bacterium]|nr:choice-of-anchor V domain-containing protein [Bacteroidota bacterium]